MFTVDAAEAERLLARLESTVVERRAVELEDLELVLAWAHLHLIDPARDDDVRGGDRLTLVGGLGTPPIQELSLVELGVARSVHTLSARKTAADALDLAYRLPETFEQVRALRCDAWVARQVAARSRHMPLEAMQVVDPAIAKVIAGESPARVFEVLEAKMLEADEQAYRAKLEEQARKRYVAFSRRDESGLRTVIARVTAGDAFWIDATLSFVAEILAGKPGNEGRSLDELRSEAFGWLARPAELLALMLEHLTDQPGPEPEAEAAEPEPLNRALAFPADLLPALRGLDAKRLRPKSVLYVHLHEAALQGLGGVARAEGIGPVTLAQLKDLMGHANVEVKGVIDLADRVRVTAYEHPEGLKERTHLIWAGDGFPHATATSRKVDHDHPVPYDPLGPPGQTGTHNTQPLNRTGHRAKTHLRYRADQLATGEVVWRTPHGLCRLVDGYGTHPIAPSEADALTGDSPMETELARLIHRHRTGQLA